MSWRKVLEETCRRKALRWQKSTDDGWRS
jgi:hypothetical protein